MKQLLKIKSTCIAMLCTYILWGLNLGMYGAVSPYTSSWHGDQQFKDRYTAQGKRLLKRLDQAVGQMLPPVILTICMEYLNASDAPKEIYSQKTGVPFAISLISASTILANYCFDKVSYQEIFDLRLKKNTLIAQGSVVAENTISTLRACAAPNGRFTITKLTMDGRDTEWDDKESNNESYLAINFLDVTTLASLSQTLILKSWNSETGKLLTKKQLAGNRELLEPESVKILSMEQLIAERGMSASSPYSIIDTESNKYVFLDKAHLPIIKSESLQDGIIFYKNLSESTESINTQLLEPQKIYTLGKRKSFGEYYEYAAIFCRLRPSNGFASIQQPVQPVSNITPIALFPDDEITDPSLISFHSSGKHFAHLTPDGITHVMELPQLHFKVPTK